MVIRALNPSDGCQFYPITSICSHGTFKNQYDEALNEIEEDLLLLQAHSGIFDGIEDTEIECDPSLLFHPLVSDLICSLHESHSLTLPSSSSDCIATVEKEQAVNSDCDLKPCNDQYLSLLNSAQAESSSEESQPSDAMKMRSISTDNYLILNQPPVTPVTDLNQKKTHNQPGYISFPLGMNTALPSSVVTSHLLSPHAQNSTSSKSNLFPSSPSYRYWNEKNIKSPISLSGHQSGDDVNTPSFKLDILDLRLSFKDVCCFCAEFHPYRRQGDHSFKCPSMLCFNCNTPGHISKKCPKPHCVKDRFCWRCHRSTHVANYCHMMFSHPAKCDQLKKHVLSYCSNCGHSGHNHISCRFLDMTSTLRTIKEKGVDHWMYPFKNYGSSGQDRSSSIECFSKGFSNYTPSDILSPRSHQSNNSQSQNTQKNSSKHSNKNSNLSNRYSYTKSKSMASTEHSSSKNLVQTSTKSNTHKVRFSRIHNGEKDDIKALRPEHQTRKSNVANFQVSGKPTRAKDFSTKSQSTKQGLGKRQVKNREYYHKLAEKTC